MSQSNVERVVGQLVTDEAFRRRFAEDPRSILRDLAEAGMRMTPCETEALAALDLVDLARLAETIDPRLQKTDLRNGAPGGNHP